MKVLALDPAGELFGIAGVEILGSGELNIYFSFLLEAPIDFTTTQKSNYMAYASAAIISQIKPDVVVSERPWGMGYSKSTLEQLIGAIKAETWKDIEWQGVSEARRSLMGDGYGGENKLVSSQWLLEYNWNRSSKTMIKKLIAEAGGDLKSGYDILDAVMHGTAFLIKKGNLQKKEKTGKLKKKKQESL